VRLVVDTNVLVSGLLSCRGAPARIIDLISDGVIVVCFDRRILDEYADVLARPRFGFDPVAIADLLAQIQGEGSPVEAHPLNLGMADPADEKFVEVAVTGHADALVTGNLRHFPADKRQDVIVVTPSELIGLFGGD
jgi:putative PIN family toxin of toxin-antitoxin system